MVLSGALKLPYGFFVVASQTKSFAFKIELGRFVVTLEAVVKVLFGHWAVAFSPALPVPYRKIFPVRGVAGSTTGWGRFAP